LVPGDGLLAPAVGPADRGRPQDGLPVLRVRVGVPALAEVLDLQAVQTVVAVGRGRVVVGERLLLAERVQDIDVGVTGVAGAAVADHPQPGGLAGTGVWPWLRFPPGARREDAK